MAHNLEPGLVERMRANPGGIVIQVREAADADAATAALDAAREDLWRVGARGGSPHYASGPSYVSEVMPAATGPALMIDAADVPAADLRGIPEVISRHLAEAGVGDALIATPPPAGSLDDVARVPRAVVLRAYLPPPPRRADYVGLPQGWLEEAVGLVREGVSDDAELFGCTGLVEFGLPAAGALGLLERCRLLRTQRAVLATRERDGRAAALHARFANRGLAVAAGGPGATDEQLLATFERLKALARRLRADAAQAFVHFAANFSAATSSDPEVWRTPASLTEPACDELLFDGYPYQILGPGHLRRLGGAPAGAEPLPGGEQVELSVGDPEAWLPDSERRHEQQRRAREVLAPCLPPQREAVIVATASLQGRP